jgi:outer membrane lipoprotein-sorting protein
MAFPNLFARALLPAVAVVALTAPALAASTGELGQVEAHLAGAQSMTAHFIQTDSKNHQLSGTLQLKRPGRIRFEYGQGANMLLVGNGKTLTFLDYEVGQKSSWAIAKSPLSVLLSSNPDLSRIARILPSQDSRILLVRARDSRRPEFGTMILAFVKAPGAPGGLRLEGWTAIDAQNKRTTVKLDSQRYNVAVPESAFSYADPKKRGRG